jgi:predicted transcriptional regulator of viral defense system
MELIQAIKKYEGQPITRQIFLDLLKGYKRPLDKLGELVREGYLLQAKRGIYIPGPELKMAGPEPFLLANYLVGPSYVSLDTALSYWGLIPERVYEISSVTTARPRTIRTAAGRFSYQRLHLPYYSFGIKQVALTTRQTALVASPEKALCDKLITTSALTLRSAKQTMELLVDDFRIEKQALRDLNLHEINRWIPDATKKDSLLMLVKTLEKL